MRPALLVALAAAIAAPPGAAADPARRFVCPGAGGRLEYPADARGNRVPDFSHAGYGGGAAIPDAAVRVVVDPRPGDSTTRIQAALDFVSHFEPDAAGIRGAVLLRAGRHEVVGRLQLTASGVVLRGEGAGTVLVATGTDRRPLVHVRGRTDRADVGDSRRVTDSYVPVGAAVLRLDHTDGLKVGDRVTVTHPSSKAWISALGMDRFPSRDVGSYLDWRPGTLDVRWDRVVTRVDGAAVTLDAPLTTALDAAHGGGTVRAYAWPGRARRVGVEHLRCESTADPANPHDEDHAWVGVTVENAEDVWVRNVSFAGFAGSAVSVWETATRVTVADCTSARPVSEDGGYRRHTFFTAGGQTLVLRCTSDGGRHDFATGHLAAGPTAFVHCTATNAAQFSGPIGSWASGVLYDNVSVDGAGLSLTNRETDGQGVGWAAANSVLWQCSAPVVTCRAPPTAQNWAIGVWGRFVGDGHWRELNEFVRPQSLYAAQLTERGGALPKAASPIPTIPAGTKSADELAPPAEPPATSAALQLTNGWLTTGGKLLTGGRLGTAWWRGTVLPSRLGEHGVGVTRFVPGRDGAGFTDDLDALANGMTAGGHAVLDHHYGLWYDRRRDDHQMVRRPDGDAWPPFYEQPWGRSGRGRAWDGLSKYDLTRFNPWYFARLKAFAECCERRGLVLCQQMYFQHNALEAAAHWADCPWRPANNVNDTGFPEPPEYAGGKRVFMAAAFYDVTHPARRDLHRRYIRHCLDVLGGCPNVIFQVGEEFTGPAEFVRFWLDTVAEWQRETGTKVLVGLSCTRDVQDAILADPRRAGVVSVIDLKYWWYTPAGGVYDPKGGENLAPRQQLREWKGDKSRSPAAVARAVREYRERFPDKAVTVSLDGADGWAVLAAGGSVPKLPATTDAALLAAAARMRPVAGALADPGRDYLVWSPGGGPVRLDLTRYAEEFTVNRVNLTTGRVTPDAGAVRGGGVVDLGRATGPVVVWLSRK